MLNSLLNPDFSKINFPDFSGKKLATRDSNGIIMNEIARAMPGFIGGSADLAPSNKTELKVNALPMPGIAASLPETVQTFITRNKNIESQSNRHP